MADVTVVANDVRPPGNVNSDTRVIKGRLGATVTAGQSIYLDGTNGWKPADADAQASANAKGMALKGGANGETVPIVTLGPIEGFSGLTPGTDYYVSTTEGGICPYADLGAGNYPCRIGWARTATQLVVEPAPVGAVLT